MQARRVPRLACVLVVMVGGAVGWTSSAGASEWLALGKDAGPSGDRIALPVAPQVELHRCEKSGLDLSITLAGLEVETKKTKGGDFTMVYWPGAQASGEVGAPVIPVVRRLFVVPEGAEVAMSVGIGEMSSLELKDVGYPTPLIPMQPPVKYEPGAFEQAPFHHDADAYRSDRLTPEKRATISKLGVVRGWRLYLLEVRPVGYNPVDGSLAVWPKIDVALDFRGGKPGTGAIPPAIGVVLNPKQAASPMTGSGNFVIVAAANLVGSTPLNEFIAAKTAQGFTVSTITVAVGATKEEIKQDIADLWGTASAPDYVLLVGDTDTIPAWVGPSEGEPLTDLPYACMDAGDDWYPDFAIGRFSVRLESELQSVVDKTLIVENRTYTDPDYIKRAVFIAGTDSGSGDHATHRSVFQDHLEGEGFTATEVFMRTGAGATTQDLHDAVNAGCLYSVFMGHSFSDQWQNGPAFSRDDAEALQNDGMYPVVLSITCSGCQYYNTTIEPCFCEIWQREPNKGAVAFLGTSDTVWFGYSPWHDAVFAEQAFFDAIYLDGVRQVGPAWHNALWRFLAEYGPTDMLSRHYFEMFNLLGDPSLDLPGGPEPEENYLIVTPPLFVDSAPLLEFIAAKETAGFNVMTYEVAAGTSNTDIKTYINGLWGTADEPRYVLLVGDTDGLTSTASTIPHFEGGGSKGAVTDWPYVCMDGTEDWYPEIPVGRFSVTSVDSLQDVVDKTLFVEAGNFSDPTYVTRGTFLANPSTGGLAEPTHDWVIDNYLTPNGYTGTKIYSSEGGSTQQVTDAVNAGSMFTLYMGHSGSSGWWDPSFDQGDVGALVNDGLYGVVFGWSCNTNHYSYDECFGETWLRQPNAGAAVYISASDYIYWGSTDEWRPSERLELAFFASFFEDDIWVVGDAWLNGLYRFLVSHGNWDGDPAHEPTENYDHCRNFLDEFPIMGDPSLRIPQPYGFSMEATPSSYDVCAPPTTSVDYTIDVTEHGGFAETVALSVSDVPTGASASFSVNNTAPPFTTVLTVSGLDGVSAGNYSMTVTGTSTSRTRNTGVALSVSAGIPSAVTLTSPGDGATDVARMPTLTWTAASQATWYELEVATDAGFGNIVYTTTTSSASQTLPTMLGSLTEHYWHVRAGNECGDSGFSSAYSFTTIEVPDYFTEEFSAFDLASFTLTFTPDGGGSHYAMCGEAATAYPSDPAGATGLASPVTSGSMDDGYWTITPSQSVWLYGVEYSEFHVGTNGYITFSSGDTTYTESLSAHFDMPRVSGFFDDLYPGDNEISWQELPDRVAVTWSGVSQHSNSDSNNLQIELFFDGRIRLTWLDVALSDCVTGLSQGLGVPEDYVAMDLSAAPLCGPGFSLNVVPSAQTVCAPADADYTVNLEQILGFSESVTLSAVGVPSGATVGFSANPVTPPGSSVMTIGDTDSVSAGDYTIQVIGTATGGTIETGVVQLSVSAATPGAVSLASPTDGATDVSRTPTLSWSAATGAAQYDVEVATDSGFANVVYSNTLTETSDVVGTALAADTQHYWRVQASNNCGTGAWSGTYGFHTTVTVDPEYFTEDFSAFDLANTMLVFTPDGSGTYYAACTQAVSVLPQDPAAGVGLVAPPTYTSYGDMDDAYWTLSLAQSVSLYGTSYDTMHVGSNGYITFGEGNGDTDYTESIAEHFALPRIAPMYNDFSPVDNTISWQELADRVVVSWVDIPLFNSTDLCTFQVEMLLDGEIHITFTSMATTDGLVGLSAGSGEPADFVESDLSTFASCGTPPSGACCVGETCTVETAADCGLAGGTYQGDDTTCDPNPCLPQEPACLIISEVVNGVESGGCPTWMEITNTGENPYTFAEGGVIVQADSSTDVTLDIDLTGMTIEAGQAFVVNTTINGACYNAFQFFYGDDPDFETTVPISYGDARLILTDTADGSNLLDIYGEFGVDGTGTPWEFFGGFSYRLAAYNSGDGMYFMPDEWHLGGAGSLDGADPQAILLANTTPWVHVFDDTCTGTATGACCDGEVCSVETGASCVGGGHEYQGDDTTCDPDPCYIPPTGACCVGESCSILTEDECDAATGTYQGDDTTCDPDPCYIPPTGACCVGELCSILTEDDCDAVSGAYQGDDTTCDPDPCYVPPTGACCVSESCSILTEDECDAASGTYQGDDTTCDPDPCYTPPTGACCVGGICSVLTEAICLVGGEYLGDDTTCDGDPCGTSLIPCTTNADCAIASNNACDWDRCGTVVAGYCDPPIDRVYGDVTGASNDAPPNDVVNTTDILCVLAAFGVNNLNECPNADIAVQTAADCPEGNGLVNLSDILKVLDAFGAPANPTSEMMCDCPRNP